MSERDMIKFLVESAKDLAREKGCCEERVKDIAALFRAAETVADMSDHDMYDKIEMEEEIEKKAAKIVKRLIRENYIRYRNQLMKIFDLSEEDVPLIKEILEIDADEEEGEDE